MLNLNKILSFFYAGRRLQTISRNYTQIYRRLRLTLFFLLMAVFIFALVFMTFLVLNNSQNIMTEKVKENLSGIALNKAIAIENWLAERISDAKVLTGMVDVRKIVKNLIDTRISEYSKRNQGAIIRDLFTLMIEKYGCYEEIFILGSGGELLVSSGDGNGPRDYRKLWNDTPKTGVEITDIYRSDIYDKPMMRVSATIYDLGGSLIGLLFAMVKTDGIKDIVSQIDLGETGEAYLINQEGIFLTDSKFEPGYILSKRIHPDGVEGYLGGKEWVETYQDYRQREVLGAHRKIPGLNWFLIAEQDAQEAFREVHSLRMKIYLISIVIVILTIITSGELARRVFRRLKSADRELENKNEEVLRSGKLAAVGEMAAGIAHEVNNPLTTIKTLIQSILADANVDDLIHKDLGIIQNEIDRINRLMLRFLQFAHPNPPEFETTEINQIISRIVLLLEHQITKGGIHFKASYDRSIPKLMVDPHLFGQAFMNLLLNAIQATPREGEIEVATGINGQYKFGSTKTIKVTIKDTGCGIPDGIKDRVFEPFFTTKPSGTGLGLSISKSIIEKHGGSVAFGRNERGGTIFIIEMPVEEFDGKDSDR